MYMGILHDYIHWVYERYSKPTKKRFLFAAGGSVDLIKYKKPKKKSIIFREILFLISIVFIPVSLFAIYYKLMSLRSALIFLIIGVLIAVGEFIYFIVKGYKILKK